MLKEIKMGELCNEHCICEALKEIKLLQNIPKEESPLKKELGYNNEYFDTIPFILQTPYGHPFFTWGNIGTEDCFVTVFFKVIEVDCYHQCAALQLLKPNISIIDPETNEIEIGKVCEVDYVTKTFEYVKVELSYYTAIKCIHPTFLKRSFIERIPCE